MIVAHSAWLPGLTPYCHIWQHVCAEGWGVTCASPFETIIATMCATTRVALPSALLQATLGWQPQERMEAKRTRAWLAPPASCLQRYCPSSPTALPLMCGEQRIAAASSDCSAASRLGTVLAVPGAMGSASAYRARVHRNRVCCAISCTALGQESPLLQDARAPAV